MFDRAGIRRLGAAMFSVIAVFSAALIFSPSAMARFGSNEPCTASDGQSLQLVYRIPETVVTPACTQVRAGQRWAPSVPWIVNNSFASVPSGFTSNWATPIEDFRGKLQSVEYFIDGAKNLSFPSSNRLWVYELPEAPGLPAANTVSLGPLDPLPVGQHSVDVYWTLSAQHCDGFSASSGSCLPAGKQLVRSISFQVVKP
jgi:hypothetical protein